MHQFCFTNQIKSLGKLMSLRSRHRSLNGGRAREGEEQAFVSAKLEHLSHTLLSIFGAAAITTIQAASIGISRTSKAVEYCSSIVTTESDRLIVPTIQDNILLI
jgi:hypothetical protein